MQRLSRSDGEEMPVLSKALNAACLLDAAGLATNACENAALTTALTMNRDLTSGPGRRSSVDRDSTVLLPLNYPISSHRHPHH
jgi:hypothetical protein